jgi:hypothetical protein
MKKINFNCSSCLFLVLLLLAGTVNAQNKMGDNPTVVQSGSLLELESLTKGLRLPRIALNNVSSWTLDGTAVSGMLIYNESGSVAKGIYYWNTTLAQWVKVTNATELSALTLGAPSATSYANGGYITGNALYLAYADGTNPGLLSATAQTIAGAKTFNGNTSISGSNNFTVGTGATTLGGSLTVNAAAVNNSPTLGTTATIDFNSNNLAYSSYIGTSFTLNNLKNGGAYTLVLTGTTNTGTATFTATGLTVKYMGTASMTTGKMHIYSFIVMGDYVFVTMATEN